MKIFSRFPVFRMVIPFSAGILCVIKTEISIITVASLALTGFVTAFVFTLRNFASGKYAQRWLAGIPFYCCFFGLGGSLTWFHQSMHHRSHFQEFTHSGSLLIEIKNEPVTTKSGYRFIAAVKAVKSQWEWQPVRGYLLVYLSDSLHEFKGTAGNKMLVSGEVRKIRGATNPMAFDARVFYASKGAWHQVNLTKGDYEMISTPVIKTAFTYARLLRDEMLSKLQKHLGKEDLGVAGALLLGYEEWLDPELENYWSGAGVLHVLCVSGMHVMLIYVILAGALAWMEKHRFLRHLRYILLLSLIWFYAMVTGFSPSVIRAAAMISFVIAGNWIHRESSIYNLLCSSCILMFILDPYLIVSAGFQLSFLAVCGIIFLHRLILPLWIAPNRLLHKIWELVSVSLAAQLSTFPLSLFLFHQFPNYFLIGNLLIIPLSTAVMYSGLILLVTDWIPFAGLITGAITSYGIKALNWLVVIIGRLPGALTENIYLSLFDTVTLYLLLIFIPVWLVFKSRTWLFTCLILLSALLSNRILMLWDASEKVQFTVYDSGRKTIISLVHAGKATLIRDTTADPKSLKFAAEEHLISNLVRASDSIVVREGEILRMAGVFSQPIYILKDWKKRSRLPDNINLEPNSILVLGGHLSVDANELLSSGRPSLVIFDSSCKNYQVKKLDEGLKAKGVATYSVKERGAFQYP